MSVIKPRTRGKQFVRLVSRLERETNETLYAYAQFLGESVEYVLNEVVETVLGKDKEFVRWRADHTQSFVPRRAAAAGRDTGKRPAVSHGAGDRAARSGAAAVNA